jgi:hypothetical protein
VVGDSEEDAVDDDDEDYTIWQQEMNLKQALEAETLEQEHEASSIAILIMLQIIWLIKLNTDN